MKASYYFYLSLILVLVLSSCSEDDNLTPNPPKTNVVIVDYNIFEPAVWYSDSIYLVPNTVKIDASLTIEAGTIIKFYTEAGLEVWDNGTINAIGTQDSTIVFTSIKDDLAGDHNSDLAQTMPNEGDWDLVNLGDQNGSKFKYCEFTYGGGEDNSGVLDLGNNASRVEYCTFVNNKTRVSGDEFYGALAAQNAAKETIIKHNLFYNNTVPLSIDGHLSIDNTNEFKNPDNTDETNKYNGIFVHGQDIIQSSTSWQETEVAYVIQYENFEIWANYTLTLGDNVVLKFFTSAWLDLQNPTVLINGQGQGVYFTSFKDDAKKGDTNGDGAATNPPLANEWLGISDGNDFYTWSNILFSKNAY